jgi:acyl carrier protein
MQTPGINAQISQILSDHARLAVGAETLSDNDNLYDAGMTSHASVNVMLALEEAFDLEIPDSMLTRSIFASIASIRTAVLHLRQAAAA